MPIQKGKTECTKETHDEVRRKPETILVGSGELLVLCGLPAWAQTAAQLPLRPLPLLPRRLPRGPRWMFL